MVCNRRYTVTKLENSFTGGMGGAGGVGHELQAGELWQQISNIVWLNQNQRGTEVKLMGGRGLPSFPGPNLATAVIGPKAIDRSKDLNVCSTIQYVDNGLTFLSSPNWYLQFYKSKSVVLNCLFKMRS